MLAQVWSLPPYNLGPASNGYFYVGGKCPESGVANRDTTNINKGLIGGLIGGVAGGWLCDKSTKKLTRLNHGTFEPEFCIPVQIIAAILFGLGWFVFMWDVEHPTSHGYYLGAFCHGSICVGITLTTTSASLYIL